MKTIATTVFMLVSFWSFSQENFHYKNLTVSFPDKYSNKEVSGIKAFYVNKDHISYQVMIIEDTSRVLKTERELSAYLEGTGQSFLQTAGSDFKNRIADTIIGSVKGRFIHIYEPTAQHAFNEAYVFFTVLVNQPYAIQVMTYGTKDDVSEERIENFFKSVSFEGKQFASVSAAAAEPGERVLSFLDVRAVSFPSKIDSIVKDDVKIYYAKQSNAVYQFMYSIKADYDSSQYERDYAAFLKGYFSSASIKPFTQEVRDTIIGGAHGKFIHGYMNDKPTQFFTFVTFLHHRSYMIQIITFPKLTEALKQDVDGFLSKVSFATGG